MASGFSRTVTQMAKSPVALGFRVKSGFAIAVMLRGPAGAPTVIARRIVELSDPDVVETRQPYHHGFYTHEEDGGTIARRLKIVEDEHAAQPIPVPGMFSTGPGGQFNL